MEKEIKWDVLWKEGKEPSIREESGWRKSRKGKES